MSDLISREAVLNTLDNMDKVLDENRTVEAYKDLLKECFKELPPVEPQDSADRERVIALRVNNKTCVQCKHYECFDKKEFPCIDCMLDCKDRFEPKPVEPQGFEDYLKQYLGENDQMIIGKDVYEELKHEADEKYNELMQQYKHLRKYASDLETKLSVEQTEWISVKDRLQIEQDNNGNCTAYCPHCHKAIWKTFKRENEDEDC